MMSRGGIVRTLLRISKPLWRNRRFALWSEEVFWGRWLKQNRERVAALVDPERPFPEELLAFIEHVDGRPVQVLEVGAGPVSVVGSKHPAKRIIVTPTDVLARQYERLLVKRGIRPPAPTIYADAERLVEQFGADAFDLVYATNCVDHMERPVLAIAQMLSVVCTGGHVVLLHELDEGAHQDYAGLHQWNLNVDGSGRFVIWNQQERHDVTGLLSGIADVSAYVRNENLHTEIRKTSAGEVALPAGGNAPVTFSPDRAR